jgi:hypothetical protein
MIAVLRNMLHEGRGSVMILIGLGLVVFIGLAGAGIDLGRQQIVSNKLQSACDAAAIAVASAPQGQELETAQRYFNLNFPDGYLGVTRPAPTITVGANGTSILASAEVPTLFIRLLGVNTTSARCDTPPVSPPPPPPPTPCPANVPVIWSACNGIIPAATAEGALTNPVANVEAGFTGSAIFRCTGGNYIFQSGDCNNVTITSTLYLSDVLQFNENYVAGRVGPGCFQSHVSRNPVTRVCTHSERRISCIPMVDLPVFAITFYSDGTCDIGWF